MPEITRVVWEDNDGIDPNSGTEINNDALQEIYDSIQAAFDEADQPATVVTPAYDAGDFTGSGTIAWTVQSGDVARYAYTLLAQRLMVLDVQLSGTTVSGTGTELRIAIPAGYTAAAPTMARPASVRDNNTEKPEAIAVVEQDGTYVSVYVDATQATNWSASTNQTRVWFSMPIFVNPPA